MLLTVLLLQMFLEQVPALPPAGSTPSHYPCPGRPCDCIWLKESGEIFLDCAWPYLQPYPDKRYFNSIPERSTVYMTITCESRAQLSQLWNNMFSHLGELKQLTIKNCGFTDIPPYVFSGLTSLQKLVIEGARLTNIHPHFLNDVTTLWFLRIVNSNLLHMPSICHLQHLHHLNLSINAIRSLDNAGIICDEENKLDNLELLDVHLNRIITLPAKMGSSFPNLKRLSVADNSISNIETNALNRLRNLLWIDLSNNSLASIAPDFVNNCTELLVFALSGNPLNGLPSGILSTMPSVLQLNLDFLQLNDSIWDEVAVLPALDTLTLAGNRLTHVDPDAVFELPLMSSLNVSFNAIEKLSKNTFKRQEKMFTLDLSHNEITTIPRQAFRNLFSLKLMDLSYNKIRSVGREAFQGLLNVQELDLSSNLLLGLPRSLLADLQSLLKLNLSHNSFAKLPNIEYVNSLETLDISFNKLSYLNSSMFRGLNEVNLLKINNNELGTIPPYVFEDMHKLEILNLANNQLSNLTEDMFRGLSSLYHLNLENNRLRGTTGAFRDLQDLQDLNLQRNQLEEIYRGQFPDSLEVLNLDRNKLNYLSHSTFRTMLYLKEVRLTHNNLTTLPSIAVELPRDIKPTAKMFISANPLQCDCELGWLKDLNEGLTTDYGVSLPVFSDYRYTACTSVYDKYKTLLPRVPRSHFLCRYKVKCARNCPCCGFAACHCKYVCPDKCGCVIGDFHFPVHRIHCEGVNLTRIPQHLPTGATELLLDHNNIHTISQHIFLGLSELHVLHLNNSNVHHLEDRAFVGLRSLQFLYLNDNYLTSVGPETFAGLSNLTHLYLENNRLLSFEIGTFKPLLSLTYLDMQYNDFANVSISEISQLLNHSKVSLAFNPWSCEPMFVCAFRKMLIRYSRFVADAAHVRCILEGDSQFSGESATVAFLEYSEKSMCDENSTFFINVSFESVVKVGDSTQFTLLIAVSLTAVVVVVVVLILIVKKDLLQVWCYSRFGWRLFVKDVTADDTNRFYDAFVSCSDKDEHFIIHELMPKLENGNKKFKLCVHFRDFPVGASIAETIVRSVQDSKRTIVVLSDSFLDDEWCHFSFTTAHQQVLSEMKNRLIVIVMHDIEQRRLDAQIKLYMKTRTYLEYKDPWFWEKLVYALPDIEDRTVDLKGAYAVNNVTRLRDGCRPGMYNRGISIISDNIANDLYEVPVSSVLYQSVGSGRNTDSSNYNSSQCNYNSSGHYEEVDPLSAKPYQARVAPPLPKPRAYGKNSDTLYDRI